MPKKIVIDVLSDGEVNLIYSNPEMHDEIGTHFEIETVRDAEPFPINIIDNSNKSVVLKITSIGEDVTFNNPDATIEVPKMRLSIPPMPDTTSAIVPWSGGGQCFGVKVEMAIPAVAGQSTLNGWTTQPATKSYEPSGMLVDFYVGEYPFRDNLKWYNNLRAPLDLWVKSVKIYRDATTLEDVIPSTSGSAVVEVLQ